jgi:hypothetical protein
VCADRYGELAVSPKPKARNALDALGIEAVCAAIADKQTLTQIAEDAGVSIGSLSAWLDADPERSARAREVRRAMARVWDEAAESELRQAGDPFELSRAKELAQHFRWRAKAAAPKEYGDRTTLAGDPAAPIGLEHSGTVALDPGEAYLRMLNGGG